MSDVLFLSLGMFIIDTIVTRDDTTLTDVLGGAGTFSAIGARIFSPVPSQVSFVVDYGSDTPAEIESTIESFGFDALVRRDTTRQCTRGLNTYDPATDVRLFEYLTPKCRIDPVDLPERFIAARTIHLICSPARCIDLVAVVNRQRQAAGKTRDAIYIWEPVPDSCVPENLEDFRKACRLVQVVSPNMDECASLLSVTLPKEEAERRRKVEEMTRSIHDSIVEASGKLTLVVRCSSAGAYVDDNSTTQGWYPAYITSPDQVIDATGAGNTFCGAFGMALARDLNLEAAMLFGSVAAALAIEQIGVPNIKHDSKKDTPELWNGKDVKDMVKQYRRRIGK